MVNGHLPNFKSSTRVTQEPPGNVRTGAVYVSVPDALSKLMFEAVPCQLSKAGWWGIRWLGDSDLGDLRLGVVGLVAKTPGSKIGNGWNLQTSQLTLFRTCVASSWVTVDPAVSLTHSG